MSERLAGVTADEILSRGIVAIIRGIVERYYPAPLALIVPPPLFMSIIDGTVRAMPEEAKWRGIADVKDHIDALVDLYVALWIRGKVQGPGERASELARLEDRLRKLGLLY